MTFKIVKIENPDDEVYDQICPECGDTTNAYEAFIVEGIKDTEYYCPDCCPDGYGENEGDDDE